MSEARPLLELDGLTKHFDMNRSLFGGPSRPIRAVDGVSFKVDKGTTFALVGESGCGKSTTANMVLLLERPTAGRILFQGVDVTTLQGRELHAYKRAVQAVFQDPYSSLSPRMRVRDIIGEPLRIHENMSGKALSVRVGELLEKVGLNPNKISHYPHQFSGGQRQRIAIARALSLNPQLIVLDEPVSALDVSIRAQVLNLLSDLQEQFGLSYLLISHDLAIVEHMARTVAVMYAGQIVEIADTDRIYGAPLHPYTKSLLGAVPSTDPDTPLGDVLKGEVANPSNLPSGCRFYPRCPTANECGRNNYPQLVVANAGHMVRYCSDKCTPLAATEAAIQENAECQALPASQAQPS